MYWVPAATLVLCLSHIVVTVSMAMSEYVSLLLSVLRKEKKTQQNIFVNRSSLKQHAVFFLVYFKNVHKIKKQSQSTGLMLKAGVAVELRKQ